VSGHASITARYAQKGPPFFANTFDGSGRPMIPATAMTNNQPGQCGPRSLWFLPQVPQTPDLQTQWPMQVECPPDENVVIVNGNRAAGDSYRCRVCRADAAWQRCIECYGPRFGRVDCPRYCGERCQAIDWRHRHRRECAPEGVPMPMGLPELFVEEPRG
jgi:hypothetical protein